MVQVRDLSVPKSYHNTMERSSLGTPLQFCTRPNTVVIQEVTHTYSEDGQLEYEIKIFPFNIDAPNLPKSMTLGMTLTERIWAFQKAGEHILTASPKPAKLGLQT